MMNGQELQEIRERLGLSRCGLAMALGLGNESTERRKRQRNGSKTIRRYETGAVRITDRVAHAVRELMEAQND